jgi:hypothetical protein
MALPATRSPSPATSPPVAASFSGLAFTDELPGTTLRLASGMALGLLDGKAILSLDAAYAVGSDAEELSATGALRVMY